MMIMMMMMMIITIMIIMILKIIIMMIIIILPATRLPPTQRESFAALRSAVLHFGALEQHGRHVCAESESIGRA